MLMRAVLPRSFELSMSCMVLFSLKCKGERKSFGRKVSIASMFHIVKEGQSSHHILILMYL